MEVLIGLIVLTGQLICESYKKRDAEKYARRVVRR